MIHTDGYAIRRIYQEMTGWDDFILLSGEVGPEDLFVIVSARRGSISYSQAQENMPEFLAKTSRDITLW